MTILKRILKSVHDGSWAVKIINRFSQHKYILDITAPVDEFLAEHYPGTEWKFLSKTAKQLWIDLFPVFSRMDVKNIVYVGAHNGSMALAMDDAFPGKTFRLIEPIPDVYSNLVQNVSGRNNMNCLNAAAGAFEHWAEMHVDDFTQASSILSYAPAALTEFPFLGKQYGIKVRVLPLDDLLKNDNSYPADFLILDVQGYENEVLKGAEATLQTCKGIMTELSLECLYQDSASFDSVHRTLHEAGFYLRYLLNPIEGVSKKILQIDGIFLRKDSSL